MDMGEGVVGGQGVPPVHLEISPKKGIERGYQGGAFPPRPLSPPEAQEVPFKTAKGFGNWLAHEFGGDQDGYNMLHCRFIRFTRNFKIRPLVRYGKRTFRGMDKLYYLQGLHIIAPTIRQKLYIKGVFQVQRQKFLMKKGATTSIPSPY